MGSDPGLRRLMSLVVGLWMAVSPMSAEAQEILEAHDGTQVLIRRDDFGVPHITAGNEEAAFFAQGFVAGVDRIMQLEQGRRIAEGRIAEVPILGSTLVDSDRTVRRDFYTAEERRRQFDELEPKYQRMIELYAAGVNRFLDSMAINPAKYRPPDYALLESLGLEIGPWEVTNSVAVIQFMLRQFGAFGGEELDRLRELRENGQAWFDEHRPINDPDAPTTIPPGEGTSWVDGRSGTRGENPAASLPWIDPSVIRSIRDHENDVLRARGESGIPNTFGSFAVLAAPERSGTGGPLLLGAPQMLEAEEDRTSIVYEIELRSPTLHIGGISVVGIPGILIGRTPRHAWSLTSGTSDNTEVFVETTEDTTFGRYLHDGEWLDFEVFVDTIRISSRPTQFVHYRTIHGPVFGSDLQNNQAYSKKMTFWDRELETLTGFDRMWRAQSIDEFVDGASIVPLSFNLFYADVDGDIGFWHVGSYVDRSDTLDPRLPRVGDGTQEWMGLLPFEDLPQVINPAQGYLVNWNNKPSIDWDHGDNIPWAFANELDTDRGVDRVSVIDQIVGSKPVMAFEDLTRVPFEMTEECLSVMDEGCYTRGTYEQMISMTSSDQQAVNILPPGQVASSIVPGFGRPPEHSHDQWGPYTRFEYKPMEFGMASSSVAVERPGGIAGCAGEERLTGGAGACVLGEVSVFPNPASAGAEIGFRLQAPAEIEIRLLDVLGRDVQPPVVAQRQPGKQTVRLGLEGLAAGVYFFTIATDESLVSGSFIRVD